MEENGNVVIPTKTIYDGISHRMGNEPLWR